MHGLLLLTLSAALGAQPALLPQPTPTAPLHTILTPDDYPLEAMNKGEQGTVRFRLAVDERGRITGCTIVASSGSSVLDAKTCEIMRERAVFSPARNKAGRAIPGSFSSQIKWVLPDGGGEAIMFPSSLNEAIGLWLKCATGEVAKLAPSALPVESLAGTAFKACASLEPLLVREIEAAKSTGPIPPDALARLKRDLEQHLTDEARRVREVLKGPSG